MQTEEDVLRIISKVTAQAQADPIFKSAYLSNPNEVLAQAGLEIPSNVNFKVRPINSISPEFQTVSDGIVYLVLPEVEEVVQDESLATAATASCDSTSSTIATVATCYSSATTKSTNSCS
ncbi:MAG: hypothetical protein JOZ52_01935 [Acidobacteria bacterium]|nr:hypothetical protein [Acidobacteriota bacterium]